MLLKFTASRQIIGLSLGRKCFALLAKTHQDCLSFLLIEIRKRAKWTYRGFIIMAEEER